MLTEREGKFMGKRNSIYFLLALCLAFIAGCSYNASTVKTSYQALAVSQQSYDGAMTVFAGLVADGMIDEGTKMEVIEAASIYAQAHNSAIEALLIYKETENASDLELYQKQMALVSVALSDLMDIVKPYLLEECSDNSCAIRAP